MATLNFQVILTSLSSLIRVCWLSFFFFFFSLFQVEIFLALGLMNFSVRIWTFCVSCHKVLNLT